MSPISFPCIERLEARIAPAATFISATTASYTDQDGDRVTVRFSKPILTDGPLGNIAAILPTTDAGGGKVLDAINLAGRTAAAGTTITVSVAVAGNGDGLATVGTIDATGIDLGAVNIKGDLGTIIAGDATVANGGLKSLTVTSFGRVAFEAGNTPAASVITGSVGALIVKTDVSGASFSVASPITPFGKLASIFVGGTVRAGFTSDSGNLQADGDIGKITILGALVGDLESTALLGSNFGNVGAIVIGGSVIGGAGENSAFIFGNAIASLTIRGSLQGGTAENSGLVSASTLGPVTILNAIFGNDGNFSGSISADKIGAINVGGAVFGGLGGNSGSIAAFTGPIGNIKIGSTLQGGDGNDSGQIIGNGLGSVSVNGSLIGGNGNGSGSILSGGSIGAVNIRGNLIGGGIDDTTLEAGQIWAFGGNIASVTVGANAIAGFNAFSGSILAEGTLGPIKIGVDIFSAGGADFIIRAGGNPAGGNAIASLTVGGSVASTLVLAGFSLNNEAVNANASIGAVKVGGSWTAASIAAGVRNLGTDDALGGTGTAFDNFNFGDTHDRNYRATTLVSKIASISIGGTIRGTTGGTDHYGFVATQIGSLKIDGTLIPLTPTVGTDNRLIGLTGDFRIHEV